MIMTNVNTVPGKKIVEHFGIVQGSTVRAKHVGRDIMASFKNLIGGELKGYTELLQESRQDAMDRMEQQAQQMGANARARREAILRMKEQAHKQGAGMIINMRLETATIGRNANKKKQIGSIEAIAYGTAIVMNK
ncbi:MAG: hypothetical protein B6I36_11270 [Desulfobacteraceae bacterium 4572_35.1]|nr:MAG: hypothetical protein B6I36_11270 [Desulfobacteraceae bacterium 4572_35.1]